MKLMCPDRAGNVQADTGRHPVRGALQHAGSSASYGAAPWSHGWFSRQVPGTGSPRGDHVHVYEPGRILPAGPRIYSGSQPLERRNQSRAMSHDHRGRTWFDALIMWEGGGVVAVEFVLSDS
jgi:hypothetical protein